MNLKIYRVFHYMSLSLKNRSYLGVFRKEFESEYKTDNLLHRHLARFKQALFYFGIVVQRDEVISSQLFGIEFDKPAFEMRLLAKKIAFLVKVDIISTVIQALDLLMKLFMHRFFLLSWQALVLFLI